MLAELNELKDKLSPREFDAELSKLLQAQAAKRTPKPAPETVPEAPKSKSRSK